MQIPEKQDRRNAIRQKIKDLRDIITALEAELAAMVPDESSQYMTRIIRNRRRQQAASGFATRWQ